MFTIIQACEGGEKMWFHFKLLNQSIETRNQSSETRDKPPHDVTLKRRFISDKQPSVIPVFARRNVIALRLFELLIFWKLRKARDYDLFFNMHNTVE